MDLVRNIADRLGGRNTDHASHISSIAAERFLNELFHHFPFTPEAQEELRRDVRLVVHDVTSTTGGGYWWPDQRKVELFTGQYEAAIHEYAHAWWHDRRLIDHAAGRLMDAVQRLADEADPRYADTARLAHHYIYGIATQPDPSSPTGSWRGMLVDENDWEMFAGLASGCMADIRLLPPYVQSFYRGLYAELPEDARAPVAVAPHR